MQPSEKFSFELIYLSLSELSLAHPAVYKTNKKLYFFKAVCCCCLLFSHWTISYSFVTPWTVAGQALLSMGFPRKEYWSLLPFPSSGHLPYPGIEPMSPALSGGFFTTEPPGKPFGAVYFPLLETVIMSWLRTKCFIVVC